MFPTLALAAALAQPQPRDGVSLADADLFPIPGPVARSMWRMACEHPKSRSAEVRAWNLPEVALAWEDECDWRRAVWDKVDDVKFCPYTPDQKLRSLRRLRELLGEADYYAGRLPMPIPHYKTTPTD